MDESITPEELERFKVLYENYKDHIDEIRELVSLYDRIIGKKEKDA